MAGKKKTVSINLYQNDRFNSKGEFIKGYNGHWDKVTFGKLNVEDVVMNAVNSLFRKIAGKKKFGKVMKSINLSQPFFLKVAGAIEITAGERESNKHECQIKFPAALYKKDPAAAKLEVYELLMYLIDEVEEEKNNSLKDGVKAFKDSVAHLN